MIKETKPERYECVNVDERLIPKNSPNWIKKQTLVVICIVEY